MTAAHAARARRAQLLRFLDDTGAQLEWAVAQLDPAQRTGRPPSALGDWPAQRILAHMREVEQRYHAWARQMAAGERPVIEPLVWADQPWDADEGVDEIVGDFAAARRGHRAFLAALDDAGWQGTGSRVEWGEVSVEWLATKAYQHTLDHLNHLVRMGSFWEIRARQDAP